MAATQQCHLQSTQYQPQIIEYNSNLPDPDTTLARLPHILQSCRWIQLPTWSTPPSDTLIGDLHAKEVRQPGRSSDGSQTSVRVSRYRRHFSGESVDDWYMAEGRVAQPPPEWFTERVANAHFLGEGKHAGACTDACLECSNWHEFRVHRWPGHDLTVYVTERLNVDEPVQRSLKRWRMMTTRQAAAVLHQIINTDLRLRKLGNTECTQVLGSEALITWCWASVETFEDVRYRRVRVWDTLNSDDTVLAAFRKNDRNSLWEQLPWSELPKGKVVEKVVYKLSMCGIPERTRKRSNEEGYGKNGFDESKTLPNVEQHLNDPTAPPPWDWKLWQGSMWLQNVATRHLYQAMEDENLGREEHSRPQDVLKDTFCKQTWKMANVLHRTDGGFEKVALWTCVDENNVIRDRIVAKRFPLREDIELAEQLCAARKQFRLRPGEPLNSISDPDRYLRDQLEEHREEVESEINHHACLHLIEERYIVGLRGAAMRGGTDATIQERYVMFMEYTERGNLSGLIKYWKDVAKKNVPEVFVWLLLKCLVSACLALEELGLVHHDIKPPNVFIKTPPDVWRGFPLPVLGDFGNLVPLRDGTSVFGTPGFYAPEQVAALTELDQPPETWRSTIRPSNKLHVFAIGQIAWCTMRLEPYSRCNDHSVSGWMQDPFPWADGKAATSTYSHRLEKLIEVCREVVTEKRPTLQSLRGVIDETLANLEKRYPGIRGKREDEIPEWWRSAIPMDEFAVGTDLFEAFVRKKRKDVVSSISSGKRRRRT